MKHQTQKLLALILVAVLFTFFACSKKSSDPEPAAAQKTLNKSLLIGKIWYNQGSTFTHDIRANGVYGVGGTWEWKNNSDTMIIDYDGPDPINQPIEWKFYWSAEKEMACKRATSSSGEILYKDQPW